MSGRATGPRLAWLAAGVTLLGVQAGLRPGLQADQQAAGLVLPSEGQSGLAADTAVPILALGAFRGLAVDYLWLRSISLREQGRHFESRQLAEQIGRLQPRLHEVWSFLGHDLAYNVCSAFDDWESRWRWIQNGISLLRDQGIRHNPKACKLYWTLGRIYHDKIGGQTDDFHMLFKERHALDMMWTLGDTTLEELLAAPPVEELVEDDPEVRAIHDALAAAGLDPAYAVINAEWKLRLKGELDPGQQALVGSYLGTPAWRRLVNAARVRGLWEWYRLEPKVMAAVDAEWGPLDWRSVHSFAIYWAWQGLQVALEQHDLKWEFKFRMALLAALKNAMRRGRITITPDERIFLAPQLELVTRVDHKYREHIAMLDEKGKGLLAEIEDPRRLEALDAEEAGEMEQLSGFIRNQRSAREDFLGEAIELLVDYGHHLEAEQLFEVARAAYPDEAHFKKTFDDFVLWKLAVRFADPELYDTQEGTSQMAEGLWGQAYRALAMGQDERFNSLSDLANKAAARWNRFVQSQMAYEPNAQGRLGVDFELIKVRTFWRTAQQLSPVLRQRLADWLGKDVSIFDRPPPQIALPDRRAEEPQ